jgi:hypothetical protein
VFQQGVIEMQAKQMAASLHHLAPLLEKNENFAQAALLRALADGLNRAGTATVASTIKKFEKQFPARSDARGLSPSALFINRISMAFQASGSATASKDFAALGRLLDECDATPLTELSKRLADAMTAPVRKPKKSKSETIDVLSIADDLTTFSNDNERFDNLVGKLPNLSKAHLSDIAEKFLGYKRSYKTKTDAIEAIKARQLQDALETSRERRISKISV